MACDGKSFGFYDIDREYLESLSKADPHVPKHDYEDEGRSRKFYCGPVMNEYGVNYYVPVSHQTDKDMQLSKIEKYGVRIVDAQGECVGNLDFRFMVPCVDDRFLEKHKSAGYAVAQEAFCNSKQALIRREARATFDNIQSGDYNFLNKTAIKNEEVLNAAWEYVDQYEARLEAEKQRKTMSKRALHADMTTANIDYSGFSGQHTPEEPQ